MRNDAGHAAAARRWPKRMMRLIVFALLLFSAYQIFLAFMQDRLIYPGAFARLGAPHAQLPDGVEQLWIEADPGVRVEGWYWSAAGASAAARRPAVLIAHGNYETIDDGEYHAQRLHALGLSVLLVEYRGYGRSAGRPTQAGIGRDLLAMQAWLCARPEVDAGRVVYYGRSLGAAAVVQLAADRPPAALLLESTFSSMDSMALRRWAVPLLLRDHWRTDLVLPRLGCPIQLLHGRQDAVIPVEESRRLHALAGQSRLLEYGGGHTDLAGGDAKLYWGTVTAFLRDSRIID